MSAHEEHGSMRCPDCGVSFDIHELISQECTIKQLDAAKSELRREIADLKARAEEAEALAERRRIEREQALNVTTREGLSASEWLMRTAQAEARAEKAEADFAAYKQREQDELLDRAEKSEALLREAQDGWAEARRLGIEATQRFGKAEADLARAVEERDDYRAKAIQRQLDFDGAAHACDVLQGKLDKVTEERGAALDLLASMHERMKRPSQARLDEAWTLIEPLLRELGLLGGERG